MNALQIIPPKPVTRARRSALALRVSDAILLLALLGGMSMSRGEEGTAPEPGAAVVLKDNPDKAGENDKSPSATQPAAVSAGATTQVSGGGDEKMSAPAQSATPAPADVNDPNVGSDAGRGLAKPAATASVSAASKNGRMSKPEDRRGRGALNTMAVRSAETVRRGNQFKREADHRSGKAVDGVPSWTGPAPTVYGSGAGAGVPYAAAPADTTKTPDRMSSAMTGAWERVVDAPAVVLNGGAHALNGILDSLW